MICTFYNLQLAVANFTSH